MMHRLTAHSPLPGPKDQQRSSAPFLMPVLVHESNGGPSRRPLASIDNPAQRGAEAARLFVSWLREPKAGNCCGRGATEGLIAAMHSERQWQFIPDQGDGEAEKNHINENLPAHLSGGIA
ncbi:hypothetical protein [Rhodococcus sp. 3-2]|uniref:hypothetical protein n=1 Tax=Rhodococcus sp. 3-2 TaxID=2890836 RepID=UPI001D19285D|nr:hypothetical protein [Rhodococcus sp. 3-2]MCC4306217.1 hypothetical protein [Rhodococcus sp. 3-2]